MSTNNISLNVNELPTLTYYLKCRLFLDNDKNHQIDPILEFLEDRGFIIDEYTFGEEISHKSERLHWHLHCILKTKHEWTQKTPIQQLFKNSRFQKLIYTIPYEKSAFYMKLTKNIDCDEKLLSYPLKCQKTLERKNYHGMSEEKANKLWIISKTLLKNKLEYLGKKKLKEDTQKSNWIKLTSFLNDETAHSPLWDILLHQLQDSENFTEQETLGKIPLSKFSQVKQILGPLIVRYYVLNEDSNIPWNIDKLIIKYLLQQKLIECSTVYFFLSK